jgi:hypothetical protein
VSFCLVLLLEPGAERLKQHGIAHRHEHIGTRKAVAPKVL